MKQKNNNRMSKLLLTTLMVAGSLSAYADSESTLTGTIKDEKGEPLIGVTVMDKTTKQGVTTDENGRFTLEVKKGEALHISYLGYKEQDVYYNGKTLNITMQQDVKSLDELVVVGYGVQKKESLTGAVTVVDSKAFQEKGGLSSPLQALQGQVPGVMITRSSSAPGDESWNLNLRGSSSMNSTEPLVVIYHLLIGRSRSGNTVRLIFCCFIPVCTAVCYRRRSRKFLVNM